MRANKEQTHDIEVRASIPQLNIVALNDYDMKDPEYRGVSNHQTASNNWDSNKLYGSYYASTQPLSEPAIETTYS